MILFQTDDTPVIILSREGVTQGDPLSMVLYGITLIPLAEDLRDEYPTILYPFNAKDAAFNGSARRSAAQLHLLIDWGTDRGYFLKPSKLLFIDKDPEEKEATRQEFKQAGLHINCVDGSR